MSALSIRIYNPSLIHYPTALRSTEGETVSFTQQFNLLTYSKCEHAWSYLGKMALLTRHFLNATAKNTYLIALAGTKFPHILGAITTRMKLLSLISIPFNMGDIVSTAKKILNGLYLNDKEGVVLSTLSFTVIAADIVDSFTTFANTTMTLTLGAPLAFFSALGLPLGFTMSGVGTISRTIQIAKATLLYRSINQEVLSEKHLNKDSLKAFLEKALGINEELKSLLSLSPDQLTPQQKARIQLLKDNNKATILRAATNESLQEMESLLVMLEESTEASFTSERQKEVIERFKTIQAQIIKKMKADGMAIVANLFSLAALTLFSIGSSTATPFLLLVAAVSIRLAIVIYQDQKIEKQLKHA